MAGTLPPLFEITDDDHGGYAAVATYTLLTLMLGVVVTRIFTRWYIVRSIKADDYFLGSAAFLAIIQTAFVQVALANGLGKKRRLITDEAFSSYQKYDYAAHILAVLIVALSKISCALLVKSLLATRASVLVIRTLMGIITAWSITSMLAIAFSCSLTKPWNTDGNCINQTALHLAISLINILTDLCLVILPCGVVWSVNLASQNRRWSIIILFAARFLVCIATAIEIKYNHRLNSSHDKTWLNASTTVWTQTSLHLSIICTAIPSIGRLLVELQPAVNAFAITSMHGARRSGKGQDDAINDAWALSNFGGPWKKDYDDNHILGTEINVVSGKGKGKSRPPEEGESVVNLNEGGVLQRSWDIRMS